MMPHSKKTLQASDKVELIEMISDLEGRLKRKHAELMRTRRKLNTAKATVRRMKVTVEFQRKRIIELYPAA